MKLRLLSTVLTVLIAGCSTPGSTSFGQARSEVHRVSVQELLGHPVDFDGQPVRVIGIAGFDFGFEGSSKVFVSAEDQRHATNSYISLAGFENEFDPPEVALEAMNGRFIVVEGIFRARKLSKIPEYPGLTVVCMGDCNSSGRIEAINRVTLWDF